MTLINRDLERLPRADGGKGENQCLTGKISWYRGGVGCKVWRSGCPGFPGVYKRGSVMSTYRHIIFRITIVAFLAAFLTFITGCVGAPVLQIVYSQRETNNPNWRPPAAYTVQTSEGWDKETGCAVEIKHEKSGIVLRLVPAGEFNMGSNKDSNAMPVHRVKISEPFYIGKYEVTQKQWIAVMGDNSSRWKGDNLPVEQVTWNNAQEFCRKAGGGLRLPSEAEWEYACRAGSKTRWCFGNYEDTLPKYAWCEYNSEEKTHEVGTKKPNKWGLYDMHGNVWERCQDVWHDNYNGAPDDGKAWTTGGYWAAGRHWSARVCRGGSLDDRDWYTRSASRKANSLGDSYIAIGFRVVAAAGAVR